MTLGQKIVELRKKANLTQECLSEKLNITRQTLSNWESNNTSPDINQAKEMAKLFNISLDELTDNNLEIECKDNSSNILNNLVGKNCCILLDENHADSQLTYDTIIKVIEISNSFIKIEYKADKKTVTKLIDLDVISAFRILESENK